MVTEGSAFVAGFVEVLFEILCIVKISGDGGDGDAFFVKGGSSPVDGDVLQNKLSRVWHSLSRISGT